MATTPNYGWVTPAPTDFVTDLPADFETFADAVDASFAADEGDLLVGGTSNIFEPLPIGANGTVLTSNGTTASWGTAAAAPDNFTLINAGGTALTGAATITVSGISGKNRLWIYVTAASSANASSNFSIRFNSDSATNYRQNGITGNGAPSIFRKNDTAATEYYFASSGNNAANAVALQMSVDGTNSAGIKTIQSFSWADGTTTNEFGAIGGFYIGTSTISSVSVISSSGNFDAGTIFVYGA
jgi:hypothetical protein